MPLRFIVQCGSHEGVQCGSHEGFRLVEYIHRVTNQSQINSFVTTLRQSKILGTLGVCCYVLRLKHCFINQISVNDLHVFY